MFTEITIHIGTVEFSHSTGKKTYFLHPVTFHGRELAHETNTEGTFTLYEAAKDALCFIHSRVTKDNTSYYNIEAVNKFFVSAIAARLWAIWARTYPLNIQGALSYSFLPPEPAPETPVSSDLSDSPF